VDQKPTTGTKAIGDGLGDGIGLAVGLGAADGLWMVGVGRLGSGVGDGWVGAQESTMAASAAQIHPWVLREPRTDPA
jgi:hypothetical protein